MLYFSYNQIFFATIAITSGSAFTILVISIKKVVKWKIFPLILLILGMLLIILSGVFDLLSRFALEMPDNQIHLFLSLSGIYFYLASFLVILAFFTIQVRIPWERILIYTFIYGMIIESYTLSVSFIDYSTNTQTWFIFFESDHFSLLNNLSILPGIELLIYAIIRLQKGFRSKKSRNAVLSFVIALMFPIIPMFIPFHNSSLEVIISNFVLMLSFVIIALAFLMNPFVFVLSRAQIQEIIIIRANEFQEIENQIPIGSYSLIRNRSKSEVAAQMLGIISNIIQEVVKNDKNQTSHIQNIDLGEQKVLIEREQSIVVYLIGLNLDRITRIGLKIFIRYFNTNYGSFQDIDAHYQIPEKEIKTFFEKIFSFVPPNEKETHKANPGI